MSNNRIINLGIRKPLALMCTNSDNMPDLSQYEICTVEPLHDFKNLINRVMDELPHLAPDVPELHNAINETLTALAGTYLLDCILPRSRAFHAITGWILNSYCKGKHSFR